MGGRLDEARLAAWRALLTAHAVVTDKIDREMVAAGVAPLTWYDVLVELAEAPAHRLRLHDLADRVVLSRSGLTRLVDRLEAAGLVRREAVAGDRRGAFAVLTDAGAAAQRRAWPVYAHGIAAHFANHLTADEATVIGQALERMIASERDE
jgi:DNA-binding MarR family transcriptional regulator